MESLAEGLFERLADHTERGTTDTAESIMRLPASYYIDPAVWETEMRNIYRRLPLLVGLTCELRKSGQYKAQEILGTPIVTVRGRDGIVRTFMNVCTHRGTLLMAEGLGKCSRLVCPYHAWAYNLTGDLASVPDEEKFGDFDWTQRGLTELPCEEIAGAIFVILTPGAAIDMAGYLGDALKAWSFLGLEDWELYDRRVLDSGNWKLTFDGYYDGYHIGPVHSAGVGMIGSNNITAYDFWGPHQRQGYGNKDILARKQDPTRAPGDIDGFSLVLTYFPNASSVWSADGSAMITQFFPGPAHNQTTSVQSFVRKVLPKTDEEKQRVDEWVELFHRTVKYEDYPILRKQEDGLRSGAIDDVVFGQCEPGNQRLHAWIRHYSQDNPDPKDRPNP